MCHFLTIAVPRKTVPEVPQEFLRRIRFDEHTNQSVTRHTPPNWTSFTATSGGCSCDFYHAQDVALERRTKLEKKYRKKGWSDTKIQRALESRRDEPGRSAGLREDILDLVSNLGTAFGEVRLSLHWYSGDVGTENFDLTDLGRIPLKDFRRDTTTLRDESTLTIKGEQVGGGQPATRPEPT